MIETNARCWQTKGERKYMRQARDRIRHSGGEEEEESQEFYLRERR